MIPGAYIPIEKIPMTTTDKTDRRTLRQLGAIQTLEKLAKLQSHGKTHRAPSTVMEQKLQVLWSIVLGVDTSIINADSNFFRIGGESISQPCDWWQRHEMRSAPSQSRIFSTHRNSVNSPS